MSEYKFAKPNPLTTLVRHAVRGQVVGVVIACLVRGGREEFHRFQIHSVGVNGTTSLESEKVGNREYVIGEFDKFAAPRSSLDELLSADKEVE